MRKLRQNRKKVSFCRKISKLDYFSLFCLKDIIVNVEVLFRFSIITTAADNTSAFPFVFSPSFCVRNQFDMFAIVPIDDAEAEEFD